MIMQTERYERKPKMCKLNQKTIDDINVRDKRILVRCDFNVPMKDGIITDDNRITAAIPTIKKLIDDGGKIILCSHMGKPKGKAVAELSLAPVAIRLSELLEQEVTFISDINVTGKRAKDAAAAMKPGDVILLENTRFRAEEEKNDPNFSKELADLCDIYVDDAFGTAHRAHCSTVGVAEYVEESAIGYLMKKELEYLGGAVEEPERPFVAILGGAKVAEKLGVISTLLEECDTLIIGGGMAYTFIKAQGHEVGKSLLDETKIEYCREMMEKAKKLGKELVLPVDTTVAEDFPSPIDAHIDIEYVDSHKIPRNRMGLDIGPKTMELFADAVKHAKTVLWNGPMGVFENPELSAGTLAVAKALTETDAITIVGGGDSVSAVKSLGFADKMSHVSTGGGASLEFLENRTLPGIEAVQTK